MTTFQEPQWETRPDKVALPRSAEAPDTRQAQGPVDVAPRSPTHAQAEAEMALPLILVVDDDPEIGRLLGKYLEGQGFRCTLATDRKSCEQKLADGRVDLVVLDVMLPDGSGLDICRDLKDRRPELAIILLTALKEDVDRIVGLELGADDYLGKPFNPRELAARIRAVLRRTGNHDALPAASSGTSYVFDGFIADPDRRQVTRPDGETIALTGAEFDLLLIFLERPGRVLSRDVLMDLLHGRNVEPYDRAIDVTMSRLRRKFSDNGVFKMFKTVRNGGYQFAVPVEKRGG
ncbi:DNA-binding response regulator, OmpR family, contains REC and winged-helix (wHTH) domain [Fulvimarina manganoxydans]|uniref:DNA-binding response regulator, OmpR family, contains REC and winged-helix (WHTH) domain n=2 Tax=Fulvimarina manganoxydans TaxID=937218 RepID=A0A1W2CTQ5_9HYPH|nr:DNA-binding response regulator, OmpR family, contains REC and winged-helix (wHTH) domain [Fulvimarina manganoxydans]